MVRSWWVRSWWRRPALRWALLGPAGVPLFFAWKGVQAFRAERASFLPSPHPPHLAPTAFGVAGLRAVAFASRAGTALRGVYAPPSGGPSRGAAVILSHGSEGDHCDLAAEVAILGGAGFGVLAFDWPGHGESAGTIAWGEPERMALEGAIDWLADQRGVDPDRIGALGFSMGGFIMSQVAARDPRLRAVALAGTPHDAVEQTNWEYRRWGALTQWPALLAVRVSGMNLDEPGPERVVARIAPRPLLLIVGAEDDLAPPWMTERLYRAAGEPKQMLVVPHASHGKYGEADRAGYGEALVKFFGALSA